MNNQVLVDLDIVSLRKALRTDCATFFAFYLGDQLDLAVPDMHSEVWDELLECVRELNKRQVSRILRKLFAIPRGFAKTTIAKLAVILFLKYSYISFVAYISKTNGHAKNAIRDILEWMMSPQETATFGPNVLVKSSETDSLWVLKFTTISDETGMPYMKTAIFRAIGADQHVRGLNIMNRRPQLVVFDDIEDNDNTTPELQPKLDEWMMGAMLKALATEAFMLFIGNMIRDTTLLARFSKDPEWNPTVYGCLVAYNILQPDGSLIQEVRSLWEEKFPKESLLKEYASYRRLGMGHIWEAEMMNLTHEAILKKDLTGLVRPERPLPEELSDGIIILDPAPTAESTSDPSAITVHAHVEGIKIPIIIDAAVGNWTEDQILDEMVRLSEYWGITTWGIEAEAAQRLYIPLFKLLLATRDIPDGIINYIPLMSGGKKKSRRILSFRSVVTSGSYAIAADLDDLIVELAEYNPESTKKDDLPDSAAYGTIAWEGYGDIIKSRGIQTISHALTLYSGPTGQAIHGAALSNF